MNSINNLNSPSFGMALKIESPEGLNKYINGIIKRKSEVAEYSKNASIADKKLIRTMKKELNAAGVKKDMIGGLERYIPETRINCEGNVETELPLTDYYREFSNSESDINITGLQQASEYGLKKDYDLALRYFRNDLQDIIQQRAEINRK